MKKMKKRYILVAAFTYLFLWAQNNVLTITNFKYKSPKISSEFNNFRILQISDLHNKSFGKNQSRLIKKTGELRPDIIVISGDLIDKRRTKLEDMNVCVSYVKEAVKIAPVYFVPGNHEGASHLYRLLKADLLKIGVHVLDNKKEKISKGQQMINILGLNDISFFDKNNVEPLEQSLLHLTKDNDKSLNILLSHRPDLLTSYAKSNIDLALTGHTHGGQIVLPFIGGLINVNNSKETEGMMSGVHSMDNTTMIISRGLGNSLIPLRFLNYPELVLVELKHEEKL